MIAQKVIRVGLSSIFDQIYKEIKHIRLVMCEIKKKKALLLVKGDGIVTELSLNGILQ